jgi:L-fuconolactonase
MDNSSWNRRRFITTTIAGTFASSIRSSAADHTLLIDSHVHVWKHDPAFPFAQGAHPPAEDATPETLLSLMLANHVARTVLIQVIHYRWDNSYLAAVLKKYPERFFGVCRVNPEDPTAPDQLTLLTQEQGFHGVRLSPTAGAEGDWILGPLMPPLWHRAAALKIPMTILAPVTRMPDLIPLIEQNPDLTVVIDHMADCPLDRPDQFKLLLALARYPKIYVKISHPWSLSNQPFPYPDAFVQIKHLYDTFGPQRLMWGTDWPVSLKQLRYDQAVALYCDHLDFMPTLDRHQILSETVQQVWPFGL